MKRTKRSQFTLRRISILSIAILLALSLLTAFVLPQAEAALTGKSTVALSRLGSNGPEVKAIQQALKNKGLYKGNVDGIYGEGTRKAVVRFQKDCGLTADGIAGKQTLLYLGVSESSPASSGTAGKGQYSSSDIALLAKVISGEARGEPYEGQVAVGAVVLNRIQSSSFPDTISGIVYQKGAFSAVTDSNWSVATAESAKRAAIDAINGWDPSGGAIYYYNPAKTSNAFMHSRPIIKTIGVHRFCN